MGLLILIPTIGLSLFSTQEEKIKNVYTHMSSFKLFSNSEKNSILKKIQRKVMR